MRATAVGLPHAQFPLDYERLVLKQVLLRGSKGHNFDEFKTVINAMASGRISVKKYISRRIKLEEVQAGFEAMKAARGLDTKVIIETQSTPKQIKTSLQIKREENHGHYLHTGPGPGAGSPDHDGRLKAGAMIPTSIVRAGCRHHQPHGPLGGAEHPLRDLYEELCGRLLPDVFPGHAVRRTDGEQRCGQIHRL